MRKAIFNHSGSEQETDTNGTLLSKYDKQECHILNELGNDRVDPEVGKMFQCQFADGTLIDVFEDELKEVK